MWLSLAAAHVSDEEQKKSADMRDAVGKKMTSQQIAEAQRRTRAWKPNTAK
jgi:hypothetical protein